MSIDGSFVSVKKQKSLGKQRVVQDIVMQSSPRVHVSHETVVRFQIWNTKVLFEQQNILIYFSMRLFLFMEE